MLSNVIIRSILGVALIGGTATSVMAGPGAAVAPQPASAVEAARSAFQTAANSSLGTAVVTSSGIMSAIGALNNVETVKFMTSTIQNAALISYVSDSKDPAVKPNLALFLKNYARALSINAFSGGFDAAARFIEYDGATDKSVLGNINGILAKTYNSFTNRTDKSISAQSILEAQFRLFFKDQGTKNGLTGDSLKAFVTQGIQDVKAGACGGLGA